jgi:hypothetical protein
MTRLGRYLASRAPALELLVGLGLIVAGTAMVFLPAGFIVAGTGILVFALWRGWRRR